MSKASHKLVERRYVLPFILITSLFFMWGFARSILDVLNKHFQESLTISLLDSTLVQASTYVAYALMALPAGIFITRYGYRRGVVMGLGLFGIGALVFIPGDFIGSFGVFLTALFIIGCGLAVLETAANPYAAELGSPETAASRLNLAQSFNGLGCILGPVLVGGFLFSGDGTSSVAWPYAIMGIVVLLVAVIFTRVKLPEIKADDSPKVEADSTVGRSIKRLWGSSRFRTGVLALFCYEISEISINSLFINYVTADGWMDKVTATWVLSFGALGLFLLARVAGSAIMKFVRAEKVLAVCALMTVMGAAFVALDLGMVSRVGLFMCYAFEAIMFPTIFAITISGCAPSTTKIASSFLMMTPLGGAVGTLLMGWVGGLTSMSTSFVVPLCGYIAVLLYSVSILNSKK